MKQPKSKPSKANEASPKKNTEEAVLDFFARMWNEIQDWNQP